MCQKTTPQYEYSIHHGGQPESPILPGFDQETLTHIWNLFRNKETEMWGRKGLGVVTIAEWQVGYDLHVTVRLESSDKLLDCWIWRDIVSYHSTQETIVE